MQEANHNNAGFTLIELIVFIVILGIIAAGLLMAFEVSLERQPDVQKSAVAITLAEQRMDAILGQREIYGFSNFTDPCPGPAVCTLPAGYSASSSIQNNWGGDTNYKLITVTVSGNANASLQSVVANYD